MYTYTNKLGKNYILYWSEIRMRGGKKTKIYFLLSEEKTPSNHLYQSYRAKTLPKTMAIKEVGVNHTPLVYKVRNGRDEDE